MARNTPPRRRGRPDVDDLSGLRIPPHSIEAEQAVLGGLMLAPGAWDRIADRIKEDDFYRHDHRLIFRAIATLAEKGEPVDAVTLGEWFDSQGEAELIGGGAYIIEIASTTPSAANIVSYASIVREKSVFRQLIDISADLGNSAYHPDGRTPAEVLADAEQRIFKVGETGGRAEAFTGMKEAVKETFRILRDRYTNRGTPTGLPTGYFDFDATTLGLQPSDLIIVAGRPAMGKTSFAMNIVEHASCAMKRPVAVFSMEMSTNQLTQRLVASLGRIDSTRLRSGHLEDEDWSKLTVALQQLQEAKIFIDDTPALSPTELRARCRRLAREQHGLGLIVIDYLQLMQVPGNKENRATEISEISRSLKALAKELHVPVIALSQLNRSLESRADKRPVMADLRESGAIEQDADMIVFLYRDEYYHPESGEKGVAEVIIGKHRHGPTGMVKLAFEGRYVRFSNLAYGAAFSGE